MLRGIPAARRQTDSGVRPFWSVRSLVDPVRRLQNHCAGQMHRELLAVNLENISP